MSAKTKGLLYIFISALCFGSYGVLSRLIGDSFGVFYQAWSRALIISIILVPVIWYRKEFVAIQKTDRKWFAGFLIATSLTSAPIFYAFNHMDIATASLLFFVSQLLTMYAVGFISLGEEMSRLKIVSFLMACLGLYLVFSVSIVTFPILAATMAVLNGVASGAEVSFSKKLSSNYSSLYLITVSWLAIIVTNAPFSFWLHETQHLPALTAPWFWQLIYIIVSIAGFWLVVDGLKFVEASIGGLMGLMEIVFSVALGILIFHEALTGRIIIGTLCIIVAAALPHLFKILKTKGQHPMSTI